jgi:glyceraldehyde-3-phosphate dehydrogenase (NAD(P))
VARRKDLMTVRGDEAFYAYMVDNQAIIIPETIDAMRALSGRETSIAKTNAALGIDQLPSTQHRDHPEATAQ